MTAETIPSRVINARFEGVEQHAVFRICAGEHDGEHVHIPCNTSDCGYQIGRIMQDLLRGELKVIVKAKQLQEALNRFFLARRAEAELKNGITDDREWTRAAAEVAKCALRLTANPDYDDYED